MNITIGFELEDYEVADLPDPMTDDPQKFLLTPRELGGAIARFLTEVNAKGQLRKPVVNLPYWNDDSEDIFQCVKDEAPPKVSISVVYIAEDGDTTRYIPGN